LCFTNGDHSSDRDNDDSSDGDKDGFCCCELNKVGDKKMLTTFWASELPTLAT